jgi:predicted permease
MLGDLIRRLRAMLKPTATDRDLDEELRFSVDYQVESSEESGLERSGAVRQAQREVEGVQRFKEEHRDALGVRLVDDVWRDVRLAMRALGSTPVVTSVAVLSLALGIGANTAIFSLVNSLLLHNLPVVEPERLVLISSPTAIRQGRTAGWTYGIWDQIRQRGGMFDGAAAWSLQQQFNVAQGGEAVRLDGFYASGDFFGTLGVPALIGRTFTPADDVRGAGVDGPVAVISYALWQRRFGGSASVIGSSLVIERVPFTIIGVTPPMFFGAEVGQTFEVALPIGAEPLIRGQDTLLDRQAYWLRVLLRLKSGQLPDTATATLRGVQPQIREASQPQNLPPRFQQEFLKEPFALVSASAGTSRLRQLYERPLLTILAVVALVLLVACANIANLLLARAAARRHEFSLRVALGASSWRLARQLLVESFVLAGIGATVGLAIAWWGSRVMVAQLSNYFDHVFLDLSLDWNVMIFTVTVTVATAVLFGTLPAFRATRVGPLEAMKEHGRGNAGWDGMMLSSGLVVAQLALSLVLIVAAGLLIRTFDRLARLPLGFDSERVLIVYTDMTHVHVDAANRVSFYDQLVSAIDAVPGVANAAISMVTPVSGLSMTDVVNVPEAPEMSERDRTVLVNYITPGWVAAYGIPIRAGRDINARDTKNASPVLVVNEAFARKFFPARSAIDGTVSNAFAASPGQAPARKTVVGVVGNAIYRSLRDDVQPTIYSPLAQLTLAPVNISISVRSSFPPPAALQRGVAAALKAVDRNLVFSFLPLADQVNASLAQERLVAILAGFFGALALLLAGIGLYGVTSYAVARRRTELGIRMALGATPARVMWLALSRVLALMGLGVVAGTGIGIWLSQFVATLLYGLPPRDPITLVGASLVLGAVGLLAGWIPAWRASRIDPAAVLRET